MIDERCPLPFPGPTYDWTTDDELGSIVGQLRQHAKHAVNDLPFAQSLVQIATDLSAVRALLADQAVQVPR